VCDQCVPVQCFDAPTCGAGVCDSVPLPDASPCSIGATAGTCKVGVCCTGCWDTKGTCRQDSLHWDVNNCGAGGVACFACNGVLKPCEYWDCQTGECLVSKLKDGTVCPGGKGRCYAGGCCEGCWNGTSCLLGNDTAACGTAGAACQICSSGKSCSNGGCW